MNLSETLLPEFDEEMMTTRRTIERVPTEKREWKPHPKSFSLGHLAQLLSWMPGWLTNAVTQTELTIGGGGKDAKGKQMYSYETTEDLLKGFDKHVQEARAAIANASDADFQVPWSLKVGDHVVMTMPRIKMVRQTINHLVHHRGQMSVYLRLIDVPVPMMYGPTADEKMPGFGG